MRKFSRKNPLGVMVRIIAMVLTVALTISILPSSIGAVVDRSLTLEEAVRIAISNSPELYEMEMERFKTRIELYQAKEALSDLRKKERTWRFSLLINIKLPETHAQPKEINTVFKIPELIFKVIDFDKKMQVQKDKITMDVRLQYLAVITELINEKNAGIKLKEAEDALIMLKDKFKIGQASKDSLKSGEDDVKNAKKVLQQAIMNGEKEKKTLSGLMGMDVSNGYSFETKLINIDMNRDILKELIDSTILKDSEIYEANRKLSNAQLKTEMLMADTKRVFGSMADPVEQVLRTPGKVNYNYLMDKYEQMLSSIDAKYGGFYYIPFIFFVIPIPKEWFQREFDGIRYFDNEKFGLPLSVVEREKEAANVAKTTAQETKKVEGLYLNLISSIIAFQDTKTKSEEMLKEYEGDLMNNKLGLLTYDELKEKKKSVRTTLDSAISNLITVNKQIYMLSFESSGALEKYIGRQTITLEGLENGESFQNGEGGGEEAAEASQGSGDWYIKVRLDNYKVAFGIQNLPKNITATHYELLTYEGNIIGNRSKISEEIVHIPLVFKESAMLRVKLYNENNLVAEAELDGFETGGRLNVHPPADQQPFKGTWSIQKMEGTYKSTLKITVDEALGAAKYKVFWMNDPIGDILPIEKEMQHLTIMLSTPEELKIVLYDKDEKEIAQASLIETDAGDPVLSITVGE